MEAMEHVAAQQDMEVQEEQGHYTPINALQSSGIPLADIKKLSDGGIYTLEALAHAPKKELVAIKGLSEAKVEKLQQAAHKYVPMGFTTASIVAQQRGELIQITTGCKELDSILEGGMETGGGGRPTPSQLTQLGILTAACGRKQLSTCLLTSMIF